MNLSCVSKQFMEFFIDDFKKYYTPYNYKTQHELDSVYSILYKNLVSANNYVSYIDITSKLIEIVVPEQLPLTHLVDTNIIPNEIRMYIKEQAKHYLIYKTKIFDRFIKIIFILYTEDDLLRLDMYDKYARMMFMWIKIASVSSNINCSRFLSIYCYMTPFKKELPNNLLRTLSSEHCNSAVTYSCRQKNEICIYRQEEFFKVFVHETFHAFGLDFSELSQVNINKQIREIFPLDIEFNSYEAYCEFWATIINCAFCAYNMNENNSANPKDEFILHIDFFIRFERIFSLFQINKVLSHISLDYVDLYSDTPVSTSLRSTLYRENTNVFAYYILKCILLYNYPQFLIWCSKNNSGIYKFIRFPRNVSRFIEFIKKYKGNTTMQEDLKKMRIKNNSMTLPYISNLDKTMRMTMCQF